MNGHFLLISSCTLFLQFFSELTTAAAGDTLIPTQFLSYNQTLVSSNKTFELGFFTPSNSDKWYLGIWYNKIPVHTVVWVANKDTPLYDSSGVLKIGNNGNLVLLNRMDSIIWSSTNHSAVVSNLVVCQLLDSGNLVVRYGNNNEPKSYIWQSFDYPSDTLFGGMKLGWDLKNGLNRHLTSWKSPSDPSPGIYTYEMDIRGSPQLVLRNGSVKLFRSGLWNGVRFIGTPELNNNPDFRPVFVSNDEEMYYKFDVENISVISRFILRPSGLLQRLTWNNRSQEWLVMLTVGNDQCDNYGLCGGYGTCNINNAPVCGCLQGFTPKSPQDYDQLNWSGGCIRRTPLSCNNRDGFRKFNALKLPDSSSSWVNKNMNLKDCEKLCLKNCSCTAYTNPDITGTMSSCVMWFGDLVDIRQLMAGRQSLYVRMAASELGMCYSAMPYHSLTSLSCSDMQLFLTFAQKSKI
ncbi:hypothetical protein GIB67_032680 [Kingdonia uniflora]|uniref:S-locus glycoprotein n=1 Tax=Kingdonia uniflora TaxID=39325 RepID=A0A7J7MW01_9MAGN|nr:hypothetical protein GIB67_032680 [Kingdonia uniflora]